MEFLSNSTRNDLIMDAIELGSNYWYFLSDKSVRIINKYLGLRKDFHGEFFYGSFSEAIITAIDDGQEIPVYDKETGEMLGLFSKKSIEEGETIMQEQYPEHFERIIDETSDAETADVWFQLCVMKQIVFG